METLSSCIGRAAMPSSTLQADQCRTTFCPPQATGDIPPAKFYLLHHCCVPLLLFSLAELCSAQQHAQLSGYDFYFSCYLTADNCMHVCTVSVSDWAMHAHGTVTHRQTTDMIAVVSCHNTINTPGVFSTYLTQVPSAQDHTSGLQGYMQAIDLQQTYFQKEAALCLPAHA